MTNAGYIDDQVLLVNTSAKVESLLRSLKQAPGGIDLQMNANKTILTCFKPEESLSTSSLWN